MTRGSDDDRPLDHLRYSYIAESGAATRPLLFLCIWCSFQLLNRGSRRLFFAGLRLRLDLGEFLKARRHIVLLFGGRSILILWLLLRLRLCLRRCLGRRRRRRRRLLFVLSGIRRPSHLRRRHRRRGRGSQTAALTPFDGSCVLVNRGSATDEQPHDRATRVRCRHGQSTISRLRPRV